MASVYHAFQAEPRREVALKVISPELASLPVFRTRFRRAANVLARLEHPNILPIYETGEAEELPYICYRYVRGGTLKDLLRGPMPLAEVVELLTGVAAALDFAHGQGVIHRDIKPANILLTTPDSSGSRTPLVADFGIAQLLAPALQPGMLSEVADSETMSLTQVGVGLGTPAYMAPEQVLGKPLDGRADQYALAVTAYHMLTGSPPYSATTPVELAYMQVSEPLPLPRQRNPELSPEVEQTLLKALAKDPEQRHPTCAAFVRALGEDAIAAPPGQAPRGQAQRRRLLAIGIAGAVLAVVVGAGALLLHGSGGTPAPASRGTAQSTTQGLPLSVAPAAAAQGSLPRSPTPPVTGTGPLPAGVRVVADDAGAQAQIPEATQAVQAALSEFATQYGLTTQRPFTVHLVSDDTTATTTLQALKFSTPTITEFVTGKQAAANNLSDRSGPVVAVLELSHIRDLRAAVAFQTAVYALRSLGGFEKVDAYPDWFLRGFATYWEVRLARTTVTLRPTAVADVKAGTSPDLSAISSSADAGRWIGQHPNGLVHVDAKGEAAVSELVRQYGDPALAQLVRGDAFGLIDKFNSILQQVTGQTLAQFSATVDQALKQ